MEHFNTLVEAITAAGYTPPDQIAPGKFYRFPGMDKRSSNRAGYCMLFDDQRAGIFGDFSTGYQQTWTTGGSREITREEMAKIVEARRHREADLEILRQDAAVEAHQLWCAAATTIIHPYPINKQITAYGTRQHNNMLLVRMCFNGKPVNLQRIYPDGTKRFLKGGRVTGCYCPIGEISDHLLIAEGFATACSIHEHTGKPVAVAFNAGNLKPVALAIRKKYPRIKITIACDNDHGTEKKTGINPGLEKGLAAAAAVGGDYIYPVFDHVEDATGLSDFNDYLNTGGEL